MIGQHKSLKVKSSVRAGGVRLSNHNQTISSLRVRSGIKAGGGWANHNQMLVRDAA
jgi:hypothetical protein